MFLFKMPDIVPSPPKAPQILGKLPPNSRPWVNMGRSPPVMFFNTDANLVPAAVVVICA